MKKLIILLIISLLPACKASNKPSVSKDLLNTDKFIFEYGSLIKLEDVFTNKNVKFENKYLDTSFIGEKTVSIEFEQNDQLFKEKYTYTVKDNTEPLIWLASTYTITEGDEEDLANKIICADNHDRTPKCYIEGSYDVNTPGSYKLKYIAEDEYNNKETVEFTLHVKKKTTSNNSKLPATKIRTDLNDVIAKYKTEDTMIGIDVSKYQGDIDWKKVKNAGVEFAILKGH